MFGFAASNAVSIWPSAPVRLAAAETVSWTGSASAGEACGDGSVLAAADGAGEAAAAAPLSVRFESEACPQPASSSANASARKKALWNGKAKRRYLPGFQR